MTDALFDLPPGVIVEPEPKLSADRLRTLRQECTMRAGWHPLTAFSPRLRLHTDAPPVDDREAPGPRCRSCWHRMLVGAGNRTVAKCVYGSGVRYTHSAASDVRAWWPACVDYRPGDRRVSDDAARYVPDYAEAKP